MTAYETWLLKTVQILAGEGASSELQQRIAIGLTQARALECRHLAGEIAVGGGAKHPYGVSVIQQCWDRSHKLEAIGLMLASPDGWPIRDGGEIMVCRCALPHGEVQERDGWVCSHCKLPKHGKDAPKEGVIQ